MNVRYAFTSESFLLISSDVIFFESIVPSASNQALIADVVRDFSS